MINCIVVHIAKSEVQKTNEEEFKHPVYGSLCVSLLDVYGFRHVYSNRTVLFGKSLY